MFRSEFEKGVFRSIKRAVNFISARGYIVELLYALLRYMRCSIFNNIYVVKDLEFTETF